MHSESDRLEMSHDILVLGNRGMGGEVYRPLAEILQDKDLLGSFQGSDTDQNANIIFDVAGACYSGKFIPIDDTQSVKELRFSYIIKCHKGYRRCRFEVEDMRSILRIRDTDCVKDVKFVIAWVSVTSQPTFEVDGVIQGAPKRIGIHTRDFDEKEGDFKVRRDTHVSKDRQTPNGHS